MNVYEILEEILEALADGRRENETTSQFRDRKADELQKHFAEKKKEADNEARIADKQAKKAKGEFKANPNSETGQKMVDATFKAADATFKGSDANRKEWKVKEIKNKIDWRKQMSSEALEILEEIKNVVSEDVHSAIDKYTHEIKQPRLHRDAIGNYVDELVDNAKRNLPDDKKNSMDATNDEMNKIEGKRNSTKNKRGERKTDARIAWKDGMNTYWKVKDQRKEDAKNGYKNAVEKSIKRHNKKVNEALDLMEEILFELDTEEKQNISPNKIKKVRKDDNGEKVEVVSVADELFPYEGDAKQQFNQKILAKINDMIEGNGSLEDLIQFVRKGVGNKKVAHESLDEAKELLEEILNPDESKRERKNNKQQVYRRMDDPEKGKIGVKKSYNRVIHNDSANKDSAFDYVKIKGTKYRVDKYGEIGAPIREAKDAKGYKENMDIANHYDHLYSKEPANSPDGSPNPVAAEYKRKYQEYFDKAMKCHYGDENKSKKKYQKHDDAQAANNKLKRFSKVQNIKDPKAASDLKQEVDKFRQENK